MAKVQILSNGHWQIKCPGCGYYHTFEPGPRKNSAGEVIGSGWTFNGDLERPTFRPSMNSQTGPWPEGSKKAGQIDVCHSFVTDGQIQFLGDCTHEHRNQTLPLPDIDPC